MSQNQGSSTKREEKKNNDLDILARTIRDLEKNKPEVSKKVTEKDLGITQLPSTRISAKDSGKIHASNLAKTGDHPRWMNGL